MDSVEQFEFLNSDLWIETTQSKYVEPEKLKHLIAKYGYKRTDWTARQLGLKIELLRKMNSYPIFIETLGRKFWFFQTDEINERISFLEKKGEKLFRVVHESMSLDNSFEEDARIEEAVTSAIYEGANTTRSEAQKLVTNNEEPTSTAHHMVLNNYLANEWIKDNYTIPLSVEVILNIHKIVTKGTLKDEDREFCGKIRNGGVVVGNESIHKGVDVERIIPSLNEAISLITDSKRYLHPLLKGIILHYLIAYIHPFFDGNGRTARTIFYFKCLKHELNWVNFLSISAALKEPGKGYENSFKLVKANSWDLTYFIIYNLKSLERALDIVEVKVEKLTKINLLRVPYRLSTGQINLLQRLYLHHTYVVDAKNHAKRIGKSVEGARLELKQLSAMDFLFEDKVKNRLLFSVNKEKIDDAISEI